MCDQFCMAYLEVGAVGACEIGGATHQLGQRLGQRVQHLAGVGACGGDLAASLGGCMCIDITKYNKK
jgi:hypothetical protein